MGRVAAVCRVRRPAKPFRRQKLPLVTNIWRKLLLRLYYAYRVRISAVFIAPQISPPHPNLGDLVNRRIIQSEIEGGVFIHDLPPASVLRIQTQHRGYTVVPCGQGKAMISGHPEFCPQPVLVVIEGSTWGGSMLKRSFIGRGMHLEFRHPAYRTPIITSLIQEISTVDSHVPVAQTRRSDEMKMMD
jgi:hypothetical protein